MLQVQLLVEVRIVERIYFIKHQNRRYTIGLGCGQKPINKRGGRGWIGNSDQYLEWDSDEFYSASFHPEYDGGISTFYHPCPDDLKWSYAALGKDGLIENVAEKKYIGPNATTGLYGWKRGSDYVKYAEEMILYNDRINNEFYVCPVYNYAIRHNKKFRIVNCNKFWGIGVPTDYMYFLDNFKNNSLIDKYKSLFDWDIYEKTLIVPSVPFIFPKLCFYSRFSGITENHQFNFSITNPSGTTLEIIEDSQCRPEEGEDQGIFNVVATPFEVSEEGRYVATIKIEEPENTHTYTKEFYVYDGNKLNKNETE